jgi:lysophospholipase L1-like esterase
MVEFGTPAAEQLYREALDDAHEALTATGKPFVLLTSPCYGVFDEGARAFGMNERAEPWRVEFLNEVIHRWADDHADAVTLADVHAILCPDGEYSDTVNGEKVRADGVHFNFEGAALVWDWLLPIARDEARSAAN